MSRPLAIDLWTLRVEGLDEAAVAPWLDVLDADERRRSARFVFPRHRVLFVAAHALLRVALAAAGGAPPAIWRFVADRHGKPAAYLGEHPAPLSFNLSHTEGMAGVAVIAELGQALGFDLEPRARSVDLAVADRFFCRDEIAWLNALPPAERPRGFLQLWTLKEAFIKATGKGLTQDLAAFWFEPGVAPGPPRIRFTPALAEREADWRFEQRLLDGGFIAAVGVRCPPTRAIATSWHHVAPSDITAALRGTR